MVAVKFRFSLFLVAAGLAGMLGAAEAQVRRPEAPERPAPPLLELRAALDDAKRDAAEDNGIDAAYKLVGIAEAAQSAQSMEITHEAVAALTTVIQRATQKALNLPLEDAQDTLDQLVDLAFFARSSKVESADAVFQGTVRTLLPKLIDDARTVLAVASPQPETWQSSMATLRLVSELQSAATLMMMDDLANQAGTIFRTESERLAALLEQLPDTSLRQAAQADLDKARQLHDELIADARANNLNTIVAEMTKSDRLAVTDEDSAEAGADLGEISQVCTETGTIVPAGMGSNREGLQDILLKLEEECVLSGRTPTENRCHARNFSFVCREQLDDTSERITYVYANTPEERSMLEGCKGDRLTPSQVAAAGISVFKNTAMRRILTCAPVPNGGGRD